MSEDHTAPGGLDSYWETVIEEGEALAAEYEGWETQIVHPGDVAVLFDDPRGFDILAPRNEFGPLEELAARTTFDTTHVYRRREEELVFFVTVFESSSDSAAVIILAYATIEDLDILEEDAREDGEVTFHVRPLSDEKRVTFRVDDPTLFFDSLDELA